MTTLQSTLVNQQSPIGTPKRASLNKKQFAFFRTVFGQGCKIEQAMNIHRIKCRTFHRWLADPVFMRELQANLERCYIEARVEMIRGFPHAISTVLKITDKLMRPEDFRRLCSELTRLYSDFGKMERAVKRPQCGAVEPGRLDALLEQCRVKLSPAAVIQGPAEVAQTPQKTVLQLKNAHNAESCELPQQLNVDN
ncbi:MAG: hypothetical protein LLF76_04920 [Planctomycetaceae bacterium]|nr:hypothetical protein [Planctomycetaceae bacterium]